MSTINRLQHQEKMFWVCAAKVTVLKEIYAGHFSEKTFRGHINALEKATKMVLENYDYYVEHKNKYKVASSDWPNTYYSVTLSGCTCLAGQRGWACKHQYFVKLLVQLSQFKTS